MTPDQINAKHGKPTWRCWKCEAERGLEWWNGLSVAVCVGKPECRKAYGDFLSEEVARARTSSSATLQKTRHGELSLIYP